MFIVPTVGNNRSIKILTFYSCFYNIEEKQMFAAVEPNPNTKALKSVEIQRLLLKDIFRRGQLRKYLCTFRTAAQNLTRLIFTKRKVKSEMRKVNRFSEFAEQWSLGCSMLLSVVSANEQTENEETFEDFYSIFPH